MPRAAAWHESGREQQLEVGAHLEQLPADERRVARRASHDVGALGRAEHEVRQRVEIDVEARRVALDHLVELGPEAIPPGPDRGLDDVDRPVDAQLALVDEGRVQAAGIVGRELVEVREQPDEQEQLLQRVARQLLGLGPQAVERLEVGRRVAVEDRPAEVGLRVEVVVERALGDAGLAQDLVERGRREAAIHGDVGRDVEDAFARGGAVSGHGGSVPDRSVLSRSHANRALTTADRHSYHTDQLVSFDGAARPAAAGPHWRPTMDATTSPSATPTIPADRLLRPDDAGYDEARQVWNGMISHRPAVIARVESTDEVVAALALARAEGLPVSIRGGGHNVAGLAVGDGSLVVDLSAMSSVSVDPDARRARVGGGARWGDLDAAAQAHGLATPGGVVSETGVAGLTLSGGLGWLRRKHGLSCDALRAATVVTADGRVVRASADEHADLFWGLRGGGGNFGVVTEFEFELFPLGPDRRHDRRHLADRRRRPPSCASSARWPRPCPTRSRRSPCCRPSPMTRPSRRRSAAATGCSSSRWRRRRSRKAPRSCGRSRPSAAGRRDRHRRARPRTSSSSSSSTRSTRPTRCATTGSRRSRTTLPTTSSTTSSRRSGAGRPTIPRSTSGPTAARSPACRTTTARSASAPRRGSSAPSRTGNRRPTTRRTSAGRGTSWPPSAAAPT